MARASQVCLGMRAHAACLFALTLACAGSSTPSPRGVAGSKTCHDDDECPADEVCEAGRCEPGCLVEGCEPGSYCDDGRCVEGCLSDEDCHEEDLCVGGDCVRVDGDEREARGLAVPTGVG